MISIATPITSHTSTGEALSLKERIAGFIFYDFAKQLIMHFTIKRQICLDFEKMVLNNTNRILFLKVQIAVSVNLLKY